MKYESVNACMCMSAAVMKAVNDVFDISDCDLVPCLRDDSDKLEEYCHFQYIKMTTFLISGLLVSTLFCFLLNHSHQSTM